MKIKIFNTLLLFLSLVYSTKVSAQSNLGEYVNVNIQRMKKPSEFRKESVIKHNRFDFSNDSTLVLDEQMTRKNYTYFHPGDTIIANIKSRVEVGYYNYGRIKVERFYILVSKGRIETIYLLRNSEDSPFRSYLNEFIKCIYLSEKELVNNLFRKKRNGKYGVLVTINF